MAGAVLNVVVGRVYYTDMRSKMLFWLATAFFAVSGYTVSATSTLPEVQITPLTDLQQDARIAKSKKLPILIIFTAGYCHYCEVVKEEFLKPMIRSGEYVDKVLIREAEVDSYTDIRDFSGKPIGLDNLAVHYRATMTPTVILLGPDGELLTQRLVGVTTVDFYGGFLDDAIDTALARLRAGPTTLSENSAPAARAGD